MLLKIVRSNSPLLLMFLLVLTGVLWIPAFKGLAWAEFSFDYNKMPLYKLLYNSTSNNQLVQGLITLFLLLVQSFLLLNINRKYILLEKQNYLPAIVFVILTSSIIQLQRMNPGIFASFFIILMVDQLFSCYRKKYILDKLFISGLLISLATLFYPFSVAFFLLIWISLILLRSFSLREWFVPVLGLIFPYLFVLGYYYISEVHMLEEFVEIIKGSFSQRTTLTHYGIPYYLLYGFVGLLIVLGSFSQVGKFSGRKIYIRKYFEIFWWIFVIAVVLFFSVSGVNVEMIYIFAFPVSFLLSGYLNSIRSGVFGNILLLLLTGMIVYVYYTNM